MRAILVHRAGGYDRLKVVDQPTPEPAAGQVRIAVKAIGVNFADCLIRRGLYASAKELVGWPITPGFEVAGTIEKLGEKVDGWAIGDSAIAVTLFGGYAAQLVVPAGQAFRKPERMSWSQATALPTVGLTAYYALFELVIRAGDWLLVHSAAGGVGSMLVQLGKIASCRVVGVVGGAHKSESVRTLGADAVIDKSREDLWQAAERLRPEGFQAIFDANGPATLRESYRHLAAPGKLVVYGAHAMLPHNDRLLPQWARIARGWLRIPRFDPLDMITKNRAVLGFNLSYLFGQSEMLRQGMTQLLAWHAEGRLRSPAIKEYRLEDAAGAHRDLESGQTTGKLVLLA